MKRIILIFIISLFTLCAHAQTNIFKWIQLKGAAAIDTTYVNGKAWYNPTYDHFTFIEGGVVKRLGVGGTGGGTWGTITGTLSSQADLTTALGLKFAIANNLSEGTPSTMRTNLGLGSLATLNALPNSLSVDNSSLQFGAGTTFDGGSAKTISVKALGITNSMLAGGIDLTSKVSGLLPDGNIASNATWNGKQNAITFGTGAQSPLGVNVGSAGAYIINPTNVNGFLLNNGSGIWSISTTLPSGTTGTTQAPGTAGASVATLDFVANAILGQRAKEAAKYASTVALPSIVYSNGSSGVGATLTGVALAAISLDGNSPSVNDRVLIKNQASTFQNGIYTVTQTGSGIAVFILTRATDFDQAIDIQTGDIVFISAGNTLATTTWTYTGNDNPTIGTDAITFVQTAGQGSFSAGNGISITGTSIAIDVGVTVDKITAQTLTNKTLTTPVINGISTGTGVSSSATVSTLVFRDANANSLSNNEILNGQSIATAAGTTTFTVSTPYTTVFTGSTTQTLIMPVTSTLTIYQPFRIINLSTGAITINSSGGNLIGTLQGSARAVIVCTAITGTTAASWDYAASAINAMTGIGSLNQGGSSGVPVELLPGANTTVLLANGAGTALSFGQVTSARVNSSVAVNVATAAPATTGTMNVTMVGSSQITITPTNNCTFNLTGGSTAGHFITFYVTTSGTSSFTLTWGTNFKTTGTLATGTVTAKTFIVTFQGDGTNYSEVSRTTAM